MRDLTLCCALATLLGCGGPPPPPPGSVRLQVLEASGGGYRTGCQRGDQLVAARGWTLEWWRLPAQAPPQRLRAVSIGLPGETAAVRQLLCRPNRVLVVREDATWVHVEGGQVESQSRPAPRHSERARAAPQPARQPIWARLAQAGWRRPGPVRTPPEGDRWVADCPDGRLSVLGAWGRGTRRGAGGPLLEWRRAPGDLAGAAFDGTHVWAVGPSGLWRWSPGPAAPTPIALPDGLAGQRLARIFRDGPALWVVNEAGAGQPLRLSGLRAEPAGPGGLLQPFDRALQAPVGAGRIEGSLGAPDLRLFAPGSELWDTLPTPPLHALVPVGACAPRVHPGLSGLVIVAVGSEVRLLGLDWAGGWHTLDAADLGGPTQAIFLRQRDLLLVGPSYGFARARLTSGGHDVPVGQCGEAP